MIPIRERIPLQFPMTMRGWPRLESLAVHGKTVLIEVSWLSREPLEMPIEEVRLASPTTSQGLQVVGSPYRGPHIRLLIPDLAIVRGKAVTTGAVGSDRGQESRGRRAEMGVDFPVRDVASALSALQSAGIKAADAGAVVAEYQPLSSRRRRLALLVRTVSIVVFIVFAASGFDWLRDAALRSEAGLTLGAAMLVLGGLVLSLILTRFSYWLVRRGGQPDRGKLTTL